MSKGEVYKHIISIMELEDNHIDYLNSAKFSTVSKLAITHMDTSAKMYDYNTIDLTMVDADDMYYFQKLFTSWYLKAYIKFISELIYCLSEKYYTMDIVT